MIRIFKMFLAGLALPCMSAMGMPHKWSSAKFKREAPKPLKFGADGKFRILHITDILHQQLHLTMQQLHTRHRS